MKDKQLLHMSLIGLVAAMAGLLFGFDTGVISGAILFINHHFALTAIQTEMVVASVLLGAFLGAISCGRLCDLIGRKRILLITALTFIIGTLVSGFAMQVSQLMLGRFILGVAIGIASFSAPLYLSELSVKEYRGFMVTLYHLALTLGIFASYLIDYHYEPGGQWRLMLLSGIYPALLMFCGVLFLPESPRFLCQKGQIDRARAILKALRKPEAVESEITEITNSKREDSQFSDIVRDKNLRRVLVVGMSLATLQQVTGINTIIYYAPTIFTLSGFDNHYAIYLTLFIGGLNALVNFLILPLVDKLGRRKLLICGLTGMAVSLMLLGLVISLKANHPSLSPLIGFSMMCYIASFSASLGPITFVVTSEIFPLNIRGVGMSLSMSCNWFCNMLVAMTFLTLIQFFGMTHTFYFYAMMCFVALSFVYYFVPETKGVSLENIESNLYNGLPTRQLGQVVNDPIEQGAPHATAR